MASGKKPATNKTAHVMNLLSRNREPAPPAENTAAPAGQQTASAAPMPPIMASLQPDAEASEQIRDALESALASELHSEEAPPAEEPVHEPAPEESASGAQPEPTANVASQASVQPKPTANTAPQASVQPEPTANTAPQASVQPASPPPVAEPQPEPAVLASSPVANSGITYVNVMQALVEEKAPKYIKMFGLCECPRCVIDVKALALNNLPPKYVVMPQGEVIPRITVYEGRYSAAVTAQLLRACKTVMENPRHDLKN